MALRRSPKPGALTATQVNVPRSLLSNQRRHRFAFDVLGDNQHLAAGLHNLLEQRQDLLNVADLLVGDEDVRVIQHGLHLVGVGRHVGGNVAAVELHALNQTSRLVCMVLLSSTVITPSLPTFSIASEISLPMVGSAAGVRRDVLDGLLAADRHAHALQRSPPPRSWRPRCRCAEPSGSRRRPGSSDPRG